MIGPDCEMQKGRWGGYCQEYQRLIWFSKTQLRFEYSNSDRLNRPSDFGTKNGPINEGG